MDMLRPGYTAFSLQEELIRHYPGVSFAVGISVTIMFKFLCYLCDEQGPYRQVSYMQTGLVVFPIH